MQQMHSEQMSQQGRVFTAEEAGEILRRAVRLQEERISVQQLYAIAEETGVSREAVEQAIKEHDRDQLTHKIANSTDQSRRKSRFRRLFRFMLLSTVVLTLVGTGYVLGVSSSYSSPPPSLIASSKEVEVFYYRERGEYSLTLYDKASGQEYAIGIPVGYIDYSRINTQIMTPHLVSISPSNNYIGIALGYGFNYALPFEHGYNYRVYLIRRDGTGLEQLSPPTSVLGQLKLKNPRPLNFKFRRWIQNGDKESLVLEWWVTVDSEEGAGRGSVQVFLQYDPETGDYTLYQPETADYTLYQLYQPQAGRR